MNFKTDRLLLVVNPDPIHIGAHLLDAAKVLGVPHRVCDAGQAFRGPWLLNKWNWHFREHRPTSLTSFSQEVLAQCREFQPKLLLVTGLSSLSTESLRAIGELGIQRINFLTDDPWNPAHFSLRNQAALAHYDWVFSPRRSNLEDLRRAGLANVEYLPFAYNAESHFIDPPSAAERSLFGCDLMFAGAYDADRLPYIQAAVQGSLEVALYGINWKKHRELKPYARGQVGAQTLRKAVLGAKINLGLVRRANRDGHSMRSFEIPAIGGCMLAESTPEHLEILGAEGEAVTYFSTPAEMREKAVWLLSHAPERERLADRLHQRIVAGGNSYRDRLQFMLARVLSSRQNTAQFVG